MSDTTLMEDAEKLLSEETTEVDASDVSIPEPPTNEPDPQEETSPKGDEVEPKALPEDHNPDATLEEEEPSPEPEKIPQSRTDGVKLAEKWDTLSEDEQATKLMNLKKSGRISTLESLASELGTSVDSLFNPFTKEDELSELEILRRKVAEHDNALGYATKQSEMDRYHTELGQWASHNKLTEAESKSLTDINGELFKTFDSLKFDPQTGQPLTFKGRLKLALNGTESVQELVAAKKAGKKFDGMKEGLKASLPGGGDSVTTKTNWEDLEGEELIAAQDALAGKASWQRNFK